MSSQWRLYSAVELLERNEVLDLEDTAAVLGLVYRRGAKKGQPNPAAVRELLDQGKLRLTDPDQRRAYWTIPAPLIRYYQQTGQAMPRRRPDLHDVAS